MISSSIKKGLFLSVLASVSVLSAGTAQAQDAFDAHVSDIVILQPKAVQMDIGITEKQRDKLTKYADAHKVRVEAFFKDQQKKGVNPNTITPSNPTILSYYELLKTNIISVLSPPQLRRLREITLQARGYAMLLDPVVGVRMGINAPQRERVKVVIDQFSKYAEETSKAAGMKVWTEYKDVKPKDQPDRVRLQKEYMAKVRAAEDVVRPKITAAHTLMDSQVSGILSPAQNARWKALLGKPIKKG